MTEFDCQGSPIRSDIILTPHLLSGVTPLLLSHTSVPLILLWRQVADKAGAGRGDWRTAKTPPTEEMEISGSAAMDRVDLISIMEEESNMIISNTSVLEEASSPIL